MSKLIKNHLLSWLMVVFLAQPVFAVEVYNDVRSKVYLNGRVLARHLISDAKNFNGDASKLRLNLLSERIINDNFSGYMRFEHDFPLSNSEDEGQSKNYTRYGYAGLRLADFGTLDFGRNDGIIYDISSFTNIFAVYGNVTSKTDNFMMQRSSGVLSYHNKNLSGLMDGVELGLQLQTRNNSQDRGVASQHGRGYGMSLTWTDSLLPLTLGAGWSTSQHTDQQSGLMNEQQDATVWIMAAKYEPEPFYIAAFFSEMKHAYPYVTPSLKSPGFADTARLFEGVIRYNTPYNFSVALGYLQAIGYHIDDIDRSDLVKMVNLFLVYPFNSQSRVTAEYKMNLIPKDNRLNLPRDNTLVLTLVYDF